jgi:hypothetical protein
MMPGEKRQIPSNAWLLGATFGGYLVFAFLVRFWGEGLLFPASDIGINKAPAETHWDAITLFLIGSFVTLLNVLQTVRHVEISGRWTRTSLWFSCLAIVSSGVAAFGTRWVDNFSLHAVAVTIVLVSFPLGVILAVVNIVGGFFRKRKLSQPGWLVGESLCFRSLEASYGRGTSARWKKKLRGCERRIAR